MNIIRALRSFPHRWLPAVALPSNSPRAAISASLRTGLRSRKAPLLAGVTKGPNYFSPDRRAAGAPRSGDTRSPSADSAWSSRQPWGRSNNGVGSRGLDNSGAMTDESGEYHNRLGFKSHGT